MFVRESSPFKLSFYRKNIFSEKNRAHLMLSFSCVHYPHVQMVGSLFEDGVVLAKKNLADDFIVEGRAVSSRNIDMSLENFISNFKGSAGIDFVVIKNPLFYLLTRQKDNGICMFMTNHSDYVSVFTDPETVFCRYSDKVHSYAREFDLGYMRHVEVSAEQTDDFLIDVSEHCSNEEFEELLAKSSTKSTIMLGKRVDNTVNFRRFVLHDSSNEFLTSIAKEFASSGYDHIEIVGRTKIAGTKSEQETIWFAELDCTSGNEVRYIELLNDVFGKYAAPDEDPEGTWNAASDGD